MRLTMQGNAEAIAQLVRETISSLMSRELQERVMARALALSEIDSVPADVNAAMDWVQGSLAIAITEAVGTEAAELVVSQLAPARRVREEHSEVRNRSALAREAGAAESQRGEFARVAGDAFASGRPTARVGEQTVAQLRDDKTVPPPRRPTDNALLADLPSVLFATAVPSEVEAIAETVGDRANVQHVGGLSELLELVTDPGLSHPVLLINAERSPVSAEAIVEIGEDLPQGTMIVLWGGDRRRWRAFDEGFVAGARVFRCSPEATAPDLASFCLMLLS